MRQTRRPRHGFYTICLMAALGAVSASLPVSAVEHLDNWDAFDALDRLVARDVFNHERHEKHATFAYDAVGNLLTASNETASLSFGYDVMDRLTAATTTLSNAVFTAAYARDAGGLVTNLMYAPGRSVARTYDADGRLVSLSDWLGHTWHFAWDGAGKPTGGTSPGGIAATNRYDAAGRLEAWSIGTLAGRTVTRDAAGLKTREDITAGPHPAPAFVRYATNTFDAADRLVAAQVRYGSHTNAAISETYLYDGNGALTSLVSGGESVFTAAYSPLGQLSSLKTYYLAPLRRLHSRQSIWQFLGSVRPPSLQGVM